MNFKSFVFLACFSLTFLSAEISEKPIVVLVTSYNNQNWVKKNIESIVRQNYKNYRVIYVDDFSKDHTIAQAKRYIKKSRISERFTLIENKKRVGALENIYNVIHSFVEDDEIVVSLDGDDWFYGTGVLSLINEVYSQEEVWLTHGTMIEYPYGGSSWSIPVPDEIVKNNSFRTYRCPSHLRTFYSWLFKKIKKEDLLEEGEFYLMSWDQAIMFPMIEMAGERHKFLDSILYVYNMANSLNDNKVDAQYQMDLEKKIRSKTPYLRLETISENIENVYE